MITRQASEIRYFFYSQAFADGLRTSFAILLPALLGSYWGYFNIGLTISLGAMCTSLADAPGPFIHKRNGMMICAGLAFLVALITSFARGNVYTLGIEIAFVCFFFSMFTVYGNRATAVGNAVILIMILTMDTATPAADALSHALLILAGCIFYLVVSLSLYRIRPYRIAERMLGECIREVAHYLSIRADFYESKTPLEENYKKLIAQQIVVNEKQDAVRELFFKTRQIVQESTNIGRRLVFTFIETVDLFEDITAAYYDYDLLREQFGSSGSLDLIHSSLKKIVAELDRIGIAIQTNDSFKRGFNYDEEVRQLKTGIDALSKHHSANAIVLRKIIVNIRNLLQDLNNILQYFDRNIKRKRSENDHSHFVSHQSLDPGILFNNLSLESSVFRHAVRVCVACTLGYMITKIIPYGHHSYWILMTIAFMLKPAFSLTRQRNIERIVGTFIGGAAGILILVFIANKTVLFIFMMLFMIGTYSFMRIQYLIMVICTTPYVLILFSFLGSGFKDVARERAIDTLAGCTIAWLASYLLFPKWESSQVKNYMQDILKANMAYLKKVVEALAGKQVSTLDYKLARKEVYLSSANISAAFQRMLNEPKSKQKDGSKLHQFVVLNHILFSNTATIATSLFAREATKYPEELRTLAKRAYGRLKRASERFEESQQNLPVAAIQASSDPTALSPDDSLMKEQLEFIYKVSEDLDRLTKTIII